MCPRTGLAYLRVEVCSARRIDLAPPPRLGLWQTRRSGPHEDRPRGRRGRGRWWPDVRDRRGPEFAWFEGTLLIFECRAYRCPELDLRALAQKTLRSAGDETDSIVHDPDGTGMIWAWQTA
jgi:hypothetical protein